MARQIHWAYKEVFLSTQTQKLNVIFCGLIKVQVSFACLSTYNGQAQNTVLTESISFTSMFSF